MAKIVAEISGNHGGDLEKAREMIFQASKAGADLVKFQFYRPEDMPDAEFEENYAMYKRLMVPDEWLGRIFRAAKGCHVPLFASVFSVRAVETLKKFDVPFFKLASPDSTKLSQKTYLDILAAAYPIDVIVSGPSRYKIEGYFGIKTLLYPMYCPPGHPPTITQEMLDYFENNGFYGFSDHTPGIQAPLAFLRRGAKMIEKHFKLDDDCIDADFSADFDTMATLCRYAHT